MRRVLYTVLASALLAALIPATALGRSHHRRHHSRAHHARVHHRQFGRASDPTTPSMADNAGTVASFDGTKLKIQLADGSMVSGTVNNDTEIECEAADMAQSNFNRDDEGGDRGDHSGDRGDDNANSVNMENCATNSLTPGMIVHEAELRLSGAGAVWDKVEILTSSSSSGSSSDDND